MRRPLSPNSPCPGLASIARKMQIVELGTETTNINLNNTFWTYFQELPLTSKNSLHLQNVTHSQCKGVSFHSIVLICKAVDAQAKRTCWGISFKHRLLSLHWGKHSITGSPLRIHITHYTVSGCSISPSWCQWVGRWCECKILCCPTFHVIKWDERKNLKVISFWLLH